MTEQTEFKNLDQRIELFSLMMQLTHEYVEYFGNANCALIMQVLFYEQYCKFKEDTQTDYSVGVTLAYITARTGLPKSCWRFLLKVTVVPSGTSMDATFLVKSFIFPPIYSTIDVDYYLKNRQYL